MSRLRVVRTACSLDCFDACGIIAHVRDGRIGRLAGDPDHPFTRGALCNKVNHSLEQWFYHLDRVRPGPARPGQAYRGPRAAQGAPATLGR